LTKEARYCALQGGVALGERMFDAALETLKAIERTPATGLPRSGQLCEIRGLRSWRVDGFPMQWFCFEAEDQFDVVRLLGERQDIVAILTVQE